MNLSAGEMAEVPFAVVTVTSTIPVLPIGDVAVIEVAVLLVMAPAVAPKWTEVAEDRFVPVITTLVPPPVGPLVGRIEETVGPAP